MIKATWRILALSALMGAVALPVSAQVVVGGSGRPSVEINWAVLDSLGRQPTLADMLRNDMPVRPMASSTTLPGAPQGIAYRPFKPAAAAKATPEPRKPKIIPASAKTETPASPAVAELVRAAQKPESKAAPEIKTSVPAKPQVAELPAEPAKPAGPQVALPEIAKPPADKPMQIAKVESALPAAKAEVPNPAPVPVVAKVEPASVPAPAPGMSAPAPVAAPQVASLPSVSTKSDTVSLMFASEQSKLPAGAFSELQALAKRMEKDEGLALQLLAYASGDEAGASKARRLSLSRALEVRKFLMEQGVRSTRIEVRALGNKLEGSGPADRVDAIMVAR